MMDRMVMPIASIPANDLKGLLPLAKFWNEDDDNIVLHLMPVSNVLALTENRKQTPSKITG